MQEGCSQTPRRRRGRLRKKVKVEPDEPISYEDLQSKVKELEERNQQLIRLLASRSGTPAQPLPSPLQACKPCRRGTIVTDRCKGMRQVLLRVACLGGECEVRVEGVEVQRWMEEVLLHALHQTALVDDPTTCALMRFKSENIKEKWNPLDQIFSVNLRTKILPSSQATTSVKQEPQEWEEDRMAGREEVKYAEIINHVLPDEMRVLAWAYVESDFPSTINTLTYKYFFPQAHLNLQMMQEVGEVLVGRHDYLRGLHATGFGLITSLSVSPACCSFMAVDGKKHKCLHGSSTDSVDGRQLKETEVELDEKTGMVRLKKKKRKVPGGIKSEVTGSDTEYDTEDDNRDSLAAEMKDHRYLRKPLVPSRHAEGGGGYEMCVATLTGQDIEVEEVLEVMGELFRAGEGQVTQEPILHQRTISAQTYRSKPPLVSEESLQLSECHLPGLPTWHWDREALKAVITYLQRHWARHAARAECTRHSLEDLEKILERKGDDIPRAQCEGLLMKEDTQEEDTTSLSRPATCLFIQLVGQKFTCLSDPNACQEMFKEVQEEMDACGFTLTLPYIRRLWRNLVMWYCKVKEEGGEEEEEEYFELLEDLLGGSLTTTPVSSPLCSPISPQQSPITIKARMSKESVNPLGSKPQVTSTVIIKSQMATQPTVAPKFSSQAKVDVKASVSSQATVSIKSQKASQSDPTTKTIVPSQSVIAIKTQPTVAMKSKTNIQPIKSMATVQPSGNIQTHQSVSIKALKRSHSTVCVSTQSSQPSITKKTKVISQPTLATKTQSTFQQPTVTTNAQSNTVAIKAKKVDLPQVAVKRPSSFALPVSIKTKIVTQPRNPEISTSSTSSPQVVVKTESPSTVPIAIRARAGASSVMDAIKTEPQPHTSTFPTIIRTHSQLEANPTTQPDEGQEAFTIPPPAMASISQQQPDTTVLHHHGGSVFATQTTSNTAHPKTSPKRPDMAQVFFEYLIQQGSHRMDQMEEEMAHVTMRERERQGARHHRERMDALSVKALREVELASANLKKSLLGV